MRKDLVKIGDNIQLISGFLGLFVVIFCFATLVPISEKKCPEFIIVAWPLVVFGGAAAVFALILISEGCFLIHRIKEKRG